MALSPIPEILDDLRAGRVIVLVDDEDRENEGDFVVAAEFVTPEMVNFLTRVGGGYLCVSLDSATCERLDLHAQTTSNTSVRGTPFTVSVDGHPRHGVGTGISARDRAKTIQMLIDPAIRADDFVRPGHINPLRARDGGVLVRTGQTEGSVDLCRLAGLRPAAEIIEFIHANKGSWLPRDVYALIDKGVSSAYVQVVAAHAVVFYDGVTPKSLATIAAEARAGIPAATVMANDLVVMFEWFADVKAESDALRKQVPPLEPQRSGETPAQFDVRKRLYDEDLVRAVTPADGKIDLTTFSSDLAATFSADAKGCAVGAVSVAFVAMNLIVIPHPMWMNVAGVLLPPAAALGVGRLAVDWMPRARAAN
jgi:3,4-dihydroxy-2-butanone 4-phosphate synthase